MPWISNDNPAKMIANAIHPEARHACPECEESKEEDIDAVYDDCEEWCPRE